MFFDHPRVGMSKIASDNHQRDTVHDGERSPSMPQAMKRNCRRDLRALASFLHGARLVGLTERATILSAQHQLMSRPPGGCLLE